MTPEPLKGKDIDPSDIDNLFYEHLIFDSLDIKSALDWMISIHEEKIEELITELKEQWGSVDTINDEYCLIERINQEYESIMILQKGLEDVI